MRALNFNVNAQRLQKNPESDFTGLIRGSKGFLKCSFSLSEEWKGCRVAASFWHYDKEIDAAPVIGGSCTIPDSVTDYREFEVSLVGIRDSYRITTNRVKVEQEV